MKTEIVFLVVILEYREKRRINNIVLYFVKYISVFNFCLRGTVKLRIGSKNVQQNAFVVHNRNNKKYPY